MLRPRLRLVLLLSTVALSMAWWGAKEVSRLARQSSATARDCLHVTIICLSDPKSRWLDVLTRDRYTASTGNVYIYYFTGNVYIYYFINDLCVHIILYHSVEV